MADFDEKPAREKENPCCPLKVKAN